MTSGQGQIQALGGWCSSLSGCNEVIMATSFMILRW